MVDEKSTTSDAERSGVRVRFPLALLVLAAVGLGVIWTLDDDLFDRGMRVTLTYVVGLLTFALSLAWFLFFSGIPRLVRVLGCLLLVAVVAGLGLSIQRVDFTGDMFPIVTFRWEASRDERLDAHLATAKRDAVHAIPLAAIRDADMAEYRGPHRDGAVVGPVLSRDWSSDPPRQIWRHPVGGGYASFAVVGDALITIEQRRDAEAVVCYDAPTGEQRWVFEYPALFSEPLGGDGPRATPTIADGKVYSLGAKGMLVCLDGATGKELWHENVLTSNVVANLDWGMCGSPLVYGGKVVVNPGAQKGTADSRALWALDAETGDRLWRTGSTQASYASPMLATLADVQQILQFDASGLVAYDAADGKPLWQVEWKTDFDINAAQPVVLAGDRVFIASGAGCELLQIKHENGQWQTETVWKNRNLKAAYANVIHRDGFLYGLDNGLLACVEVDSGKRRWKGGRYGHGQVLLSDDLLLILTEQGELALVEATPEGFHELGRVPAIEGRTWNNHVLVDGRAYVRNHLEMACYELPLQRAEQAGSESNDSGGEQADAGVAPEP